MVMGMEEKQDMCLFEAFEERLAFAASNGENEWPFGY